MSLVRGFGESPFVGMTASRTADADFICWLFTCQHSFDFVECLHVGDVYEKMDCDGNRGGFGN
jgi:hypothetical protein